MRSGWGLRRIRMSNEQRGFTLLESLLVLALASSVVLIFALGLMTVVRTDGDSKSKQEMSAALTSFSEGLRRATFLRCCPGDASCLNGANSVTDAWLDNFKSLFGNDQDLADTMNGLKAYEVIGVTYWQSGDYSTPLTTPGGFQAACVPVTDVVKLEIRVSTVAGSETGEVIVRDQETTN